MRANEARAAGDKDTHTSGQSSVVSELVITGLAGW
jgi:hypothetical protein